MRTLFMVLMIAGLMSTVGVYAAGLGGAPTIKTVGGTAAETVSSPVSSAISIDWNFTGDQVSGGDVTFTPDASGVHVVTLAAGGQTQSLTTASLTASNPETSTLTFGSAVEASTVTTAKVTIEGP